jgi:alpha-ribazole phosphatase
MPGAAVTRWWWVRHAPVPGAPARLYGQRDEACDIGDTPAFAALAALLPRDAIRIVTPLQRTRTTLAAIDAADEGARGGGRVGGDQASPAPPLVEPDLVEQHFGAWQGLTWAEMQAADPVAYRAFWADPTANAPPGGESFAAVMARTAAAIERLTGRFAGREIVAVAHGGPIRAAVGLALGLDPRATMAIAVDNLSVTRLARLPPGDRATGIGGAWRVEAVNAPCRWP